MVFMASRDSLSLSEPLAAVTSTSTPLAPDRSMPSSSEQAVACPLLEGIDLSGAKGVLVLITAAQGSLKLKESQLAMNTIRAYASPDAHVIYGAAYDDSLGDSIRVTVVQGGLRTGTDNMPFVMPTVNNAGGQGVGTAGQDYGQMSVPSVWRRSPDRTHAAARVDALSSGGMDDLEIPAFLRKQAD